VKYSPAPSRSQSKGATEGELHGATPQTPVKGCSGVTQILKGSITMRIQHNIAAMNSYRNYGNNVSAVNKNLEKLSSGYKINRAGDDAAGLAISEKMRAQITGLNAAQKNVKDGISLVKTAEGAMQEIQDMLNRMVYLAQESANGTYDESVDRANLQKEVNSLKSEINRIADSANFNGIKLLDGTQSGVTSITMASVNLGAADDKCKFTVSYSVSTKELIGGTISIGTKTFEIKEASAKAGKQNGDWEGDTYYVSTKSGSVSDIMQAVAQKCSDAGIFAKDIDGTKLEFQLDASNDGELKFEAKTDGKIDLNTIPLVSINKGLKLQIGDSSRGYNQIRVGIGDMHASKLGLDEVDISTQDAAGKSVDYIKWAINQVSSTRGDLGAVQNRLEHTQNNLSVMAENIQDAESTIRDTDVADEMMAYTKNNILVQSAQAMLAQANQIPQGVLQLLG